MQVDQELRLAGEVDAVPRARHFVSDALTDLVDPQLVADAELAISELVTNALLHAGPAVTIHLVLRDEGLRLEVHDQSRAAPMRALATTETMTGRGIALVEVLARRWGVEPTESGKVVWCELGPRAQAASLGRRLVRDLDVDALLAAWDSGWREGRPGEEPVFTVRLGDVPTDLLLAAKEHIDNVVREFTLASTGAAAGTSSAVPQHMVDLIDTVVHRFAEARQSIKRQALAAAARGNARTELVLSLPLEAAEAAEAYLAALDQTDAYARAVRLLTLATPPQHRAFREWYVRSLVSQLRAAADGKPAGPAQTFEGYLLTHLDTIAKAQTSAESLADRLAHLQQLTADLTKVSEVDDIARIVVDHAADAFGASFACLYLIDGDNLRSSGMRGVTEERMAPWTAVPLSADLPATQAVRTNLPVVVPVGSGFDKQFPTLEEKSLVCVPLTVGDRQLGVITLTFSPERDVHDADEIAFLKSLADACAQAIDRAHALGAARETADKLAFLAEASAELAASLDFRTTLGNVARLVVPRLADWCTVHTLGADGLDNIAVAHVDPAKVRMAEEVRSRYPTDPAATTGLPQVMRTGVAELYPEITDDMLVATAKDEQHLQMLRELGLASVMIAPLTGTDGTFGAITMVYAESGRRYTKADLLLAEELAHRAAMAVEHARAFDQQTGRLATITRIAEAAQHAILAPVPEKVGPIHLAGAYVSAAKDALVGGDMYEVVATPGVVRLLIGDVRGKGLDAIRLATVVLGFFRSSAVEWSTLAGLARQMDSRLSPYLGDEDFVTALLVDIDDDGHCQIVSCGHPVPLLAHDGRLMEVGCPPTLPLGLGATPSIVNLQLTPGDRLLMYTDGLVEARDETGEFADLLQVAAPLGRRNLKSALAKILERLHEKTGPEMDDDLALLLAEYRPTKVDPHIEVVRPSSSHFAYRLGER